MAQRSVRYGDLVLEYGAWKNPRLFTGLDEASITELSGDIKHRGLLDGILIQRVRNGSDSTWIELVIDGQRRLKALPGAGYGKDAMIPVIDFTDEILPEMNEEAAIKLLDDMAAKGAHREGLSSYEQAANAARMKAAGRSNQAIGRAIRRDASWVSRMLTARDSASPKLMASWKAGEVTDEQFKDLATVKETRDQNKALEETKALRDEGDRSEARHKAKEIAANAREASKPSKPEKKAEPSAPKPERKAPGRVLLEELVSIGEKRKPNHDYVKGLMDGARYALGDLSPEEFSSPWRKYIARIEGSGKPARKTKPKKATKKGRK